MTYIYIRTRTKVNSIVQSRNYESLEFLHKNERQNIAK